jgi:hypothetical protein
MTKTGHDSTIKYNIPAGNKDNTARQEIVMAMFKNEYDKLIICYASQHIR